MAKTRFYKIWKGMVARCNRKQDHLYGGRGITYCERWKEFLNFKEDMYESYQKHVEEFGERDTTLDRIDVNGNYHKENCRWATWDTQSKNKRGSRYVNDIPAIDFAKQNNIPYTTVIGRLNKGYYKEELNNE